MRPYCSALCRDETHAMRQLHPLDQDGLPLAEPRAWPARSKNDFGLRFRDMDEVANAYALILLRDPCSYCGAPISRYRDMQVDHIEPFSQGGSGSWENLTAACINCNSSKCDAPLLDWLLRSPRLGALRRLRLQLCLDV